MNKRVGKKIAVMTAIIMGFMIFAFMPAASAAVTSFTVTPGTGIAGAVQSYSAYVITDGVTSINITIPAGFIAVMPMSGGVEIARVDFYKGSTKAYYGSATITANDTNWTSQVDIYCEFGGDAITTTQDVDYAPGKTNTFESGFAGDTSSAIITLPTEALDGSIKITINSTAFLLDAVMTTIKQFVRNPLTAGDYTFTADGVDEIVTITAPGGCGIVFDNGRWFVDTTGDHVADKVFMYGFPGATPLIGDFGSEDTAVVGTLLGHYLWFVDTTGNHEADEVFLFGVAGAESTPLVGDIDQDGTDDIAVVNAYGGNYKWSVDTTGNHVADKEFWFGFEGATPLVGDIDQDGTDDIAVIGAYGGNYKWFVDTTGNHVADEEFWFGFAGAIPLVGDIDKDGTDDIAVIGAYGGNYKWFVDTNGDHVADEEFWFGFAGSIPLVGNIG
jgi:hypothetical protein